MASDVKVIGDERLVATLHAAANELADLPGAQAKVSGVVTAQARVLAPRQSGRLAASLTPDPAPHEAAVMSEIAYAGVIHYGWPRRNIAAHPFADAAVVATEDQIMGIYLAETQQVLNQVKGA